MTKDLAKAICGMHEESVRMGERGQQILASTLLTATSALISGRGRELLEHMAQFAQAELARLQTIGRN